MSGSIKRFERIVSLAYGNDIDLYIYFSPAHARLYEAQCIVGRWFTIEDMKREVVKIVEDQAKNSGVDPYPVWEFSGCNTVTVETVPVENDSENMMNWYREGSHYTRETAKLILDKIPSGSEVISDFGVKKILKNIYAIYVSSVIPTWKRTRRSLNNCDSYSKRSGD